MFLKIAVPNISENSLENRILMMKCAFSKVAALQPASLLKVNPTTGVFLQIFQNFQNSCSIEHL